MKVADGGERLDSFAEAHLVANDHPALLEGELGPERLVTPQRRSKESRVQGVSVDRSGDLRWNETLDGCPVRFQLCDFDKQAVECRHPLVVVLPQHAVIGWRPGGHRHKRALQSCYPSVSLSA